jgi:hypothetical protein
MTFFPKYTKLREAQIETFRASFTVLWYGSIKKLRTAVRYLPQG